MIGALNMIEDVGIKPTRVFLKLIELMREFQGVFYVTVLSQNKAQVLY